MSIPSNVNRGPQLNAVAIAWSAISFVVIVLRCVSRFAVRMHFGLDDYLILAAATCAFTFNGFIIATVQYNHYGRHEEYVSEWHVGQFLRGFYALTLLYPWALNLSKLSLIALYWRIFRIAKGKWPIITVAGLHVALLIGTFVSGCIGCLPTYEAWNPRWSGDCINIDGGFIGGECCTIVLDLFVLLMPVYFISQIHQSLEWKMNASVTFLLGLSATVVSSLRLWRLVVAFEQPPGDQIYTQVDFGFWGVIEINLWILVASIPALRPLVRGLVRGSVHIASRPTSMAPTASVHNPPMEPREAATGNFTVPNPRQHDEIDERALMGRSWVLEKETESHESHESRGSGDSSALESKTSSTRDNP